MCALCLGILLPCLQGATTRIISTQSRYGCVLCLTDHDALGRLRLDALGHVHHQQHHVDDLPHTVSSRQTRSSCSSSSGGFEALISFVCLKLGPQEAQESPRSSAPPVAARRPGCNAGTGVTAPIPDCEEMAVVLPRHAVSDGAILVVSSAVGQAMCTMCAPAVGAGYVRYVRTCIRAGYMCAMWGQPPARRP